jgi:hypothetical protein
MHNTQVGSGREAWVVGVSLGGSGLFALLGLFLGRVL